MHKTDIHNFRRRLERIEAGIQGAKISGKDRTAILQFRDQCLADGLGLPRIVKYLQTLKRLCELSSCAITEASHKDIVAALARIELLDYSAWTKHDYKLALRKYLSFLGKDELADQIRLTPVHEGKLPEELLTLEDVRDLLKVSRRLEDRAFLLVLWESGCRVGELLALQHRHVTFDAQGAVAIVEGKTGMRRLRLIEAAPALDEWISCRSIKPEECIFPASYRAYTKRLRTLARRAGIEKRIYPHLFRHSRATYLAGYLTEWQLKAYMGWTPGSDMARIYVHLNGADLDAALTRVPTLLGVQHAAAQPRSTQLRM